MIFEAALNVSFVASTLFILSILNTKYKKYLRATGWFILSLILITISPYLWTIQDSLVQSSLSIIGGLYGTYISVLIAKGRINLKRTTIMAAISMYILLVFYNFPKIQINMIQLVAEHSSIVLEWIGYNISLNKVDGGVILVFENTDPTLRTKIVGACTGIGSLAIFIGLSLSLVDVKWYYRIISAILFSLLIYLLNIARNVFIAGAYGGQWLHIKPELIGSIFGRSDEWVSYYVADKIISQSLSVVALVILALIVLRLSPGGEKLEQEWFNVIDSTVDIFRKTKN